MEDNQHSTKSDHYSLAVHSKDNTHEIFNRVFHKTLGEEGGYEDRRNKIDAPTNMGIRQDTLDRFKKAHPKESSNLPIKVRDLSLEQAKLIAKTDFFDKYRINELKHKALQETMFDAFFNHSPIAPALWAQKSINQHTSLHVTEDGGLGSLSAKYESNNNPRAKGYDKNGGHSYGRYQIETRHGTMLDYIKYLKSKPEYRDFADTLNDAGGYEGAYNKTEDFVTAWDKLSANRDFNDSQQQFILDKKLAPVLRGVKKIKGFDVEKRDFVIKQMLYSLATQHGEGNALELIRNAIGDSAENLSDEDLINRIYDERSKVDIYFQGSTLSDRENIKKNRLPQERRKALRDLRK